MIHKRPLDSSCELQVYLQKTKTWRLSSYIRRTGLQSAKSVWAAGVPRSPHPLYVCACVSRKAAAQGFVVMSLFSMVFEAKCYTERYPYPPYLGFQAGGSPAVATGLTANFTWWALIRRISTTAGVQRSGHYKLTATRDRPLTYEQANPPYRVGVTKSWNSWNTSILHTP